MLVSRRDRDLATLPGPAVRNLRARSLGSLECHHYAAPGSVLWEGSRGALMPVGS